MHTRRLSWQTNAEKIIREICALTQIFEDTDPKPGVSSALQDPQNALELVGAGGVEALSELLDCPWEGARQAASAALTQVSVHEAKWNEEFNLLQSQGLEVRFALDS